MHTTTYGGGMAAAVEAAADQTADLGNNQPVTITALGTSWIKLDETVFTRQMGRD